LRRRFCDGLNSHVVDGAREAAVPWLGLGLSRVCITSMMNRSSHRRAEVYDAAFSY
jgi:hypothetical protein